LSDENTTTYEEIRSEVDANGQKSEPNQTEHPVDRLSACKEMTELYFRRFSQIFFESYGDMSWSLEGFWYPSNTSLDSRSQLTILQLRPTPGDRPGNHVENSFSRNDFVLYETNFSWGKYDIGPFEMSEENLENMSGVFLRKSEASSLSELMEKRVLDELINGNSLLLVDCFRGFCLSHERWFLPTPPSLRKKFSFIHIPRRIFMAHKGRHVRIVSSGRRGYILRAF
jgi:hypothetical protein